MDIALRCQCGAFEGVALNITPSAGLRAKCFCDDCQAFAHHLGRAHDVLDENAGTDIFGTSPSRVRIIRGGEHLRVMRLSPKGLLRWHTECCSTPLANTIANPKITYAGLFTIMMDFENPAVDADSAIGPLKYGLQGRFAVGTPPAWVSKGAPLGFLAGVGLFLAKSFLRGGNTPSPFFGDDLQPRLQPRVLSREEREALRPLCGPEPHEQAGF